MPKGAIWKSLCLTSPFWNRHHFKNSNLVQYFSFGKWNTLYWQIFQEGFDWLINQVIIIFEWFGIALKQKIYRKASFIETFKNFGTFTVKLSSYNFLWLCTVAIMKVFLSHWFLILSINSLKFVPLKSAPVFIFIPIQFKR